MPLPGQKIQSDNSKVEYICYKDQEISDMYKILTGNGDPEKGLCYQVSIVRNTLNEIKHSLSNSVEIEKEIEIQKRVRNEIDGIKNIKFSKRTTIYGLILYALMLIGTLVMGFVNLKHSEVIKETTANTKSEVDLINVPVSTPRGIVLMPSGVALDSIKQ